MGYTNSSLVDCVVKSPNHSGTRTHKIDRITPHIVVGQLKAENIGGCFDETTRRASANYGIGFDGRVCLIVDEENRSWCSSSSENDQRAITIECASDKTSPYALNDTVYNKLIELCVDICKRNGIKKLLWLGSKEASLAYQPKDDEAILTCHKWFKATACPGEWLYAREADIAEKVTAKLNPAAPAAPVTAPSKLSEVTLRRGSSGEAVGVLQTALNKVFNAGLAVDNKFGPATEKAVKAFQSQYSYVCGSADGVVGPKTRSAINTLLAGGTLNAPAQSAPAPAPSLITPIPAAPVAVMGIITASKLNVRKGPGTKYASVGVVSKGTEVRIWSEQNGWYEIDSNKWVSAKYVQKK